MSHSLYLKKALEYHKLGFNVSHIKPQSILLKSGRTEETYKKPSTSITSFYKERQTIDQINSYDWDKACGVGIILGYKNLRVIDIDLCNDNIVIESICETLGLPVNYEWVVKTGSHNGYHIYFYCEDHNYKIPKGKVKAFVPFRHYSSSFGHIELRWDGHVVAPPSSHLSGNSYQFNNVFYMPKNKPQTITMQNLENLIHRYCFDVKKYYREHESNSHYQYFLDDEYAYHFAYPSGGGITTFGIYKLPFYLFLDLETNGLPSVYEDPDKDWQNWPEVVQIAYLICDADGKRIKEESNYIKPDDWELSYDASEFLNLSNEDLLRKGRPLVESFESLFNDEEFFYSSFGRDFPFKYIIGHNIEYDINCLKATITKINNKNEHKYNSTACSISKLIKQIPLLCTMKTTTEFCALGGYRGNKYPKLEELFEKLFDENIEGQHNAVNDVRATAACFWRLKDLGILDSTI